jgi:hypothetical protein
VTRALHRARRALVAALAALAPVSSCGYSAGPLSRPTEQRVHVPIFGNRTWYRDLEVQLTKSVEKELASRPGISIVAPERADIVLAGTIVDFQQRVLSEDQQDRVRESSVVTVVRIEVKDARTGAVRRVWNESDRAEFLTASGQTLASATAESFVDLARRIADGLEDDFPRASAATRGSAAPADAPKERGNGDSTKR